MVATAAQPQPEVRGETIGYTFPLTTLGNEERVGITYSDEFVAANPHLRRIQEIRATERARATEEARQRDEDERTQVPLFRRDQLLWSEDDLPRADTGVLLTTRAEIKRWIENKVSQEFVGEPINNNTRWAVATRISNLMNYQMSVGNINFNVHPNEVIPRVDIETGFLGEETGVLHFDLPPYINRANVDADRPLPDKLDSFMVGATLLTTRDRFKLQIKRQLAPAVINHRGDRRRVDRTYSHNNFNNPKGNEIVALQLLKSMVEPDVFKKYLRHKFITVQAQSGLMYQIQRKNHLIIVWDKGQRIGNLCVYLQDNTIPPTDEVITKLLICQHDEEDLWNRSNASFNIDPAKNEKVKSLNVKAIDKYIRFDDNFRLGVSSRGFARNAA